MPAAADAKFSEHVQMCLAPFQGLVALRVSLGYQAHRTNPTVHVSAIARRPENVQSVGFVVESNLALPSSATVFPTTASVS